MRVRNRLMRTFSRTAVSVGLYLMYALWPGQASAMTPASYSITNLAVYESSTTTLSDGTAICTGLDLTAGSVNCGSDILAGGTYQFQVTVTNSGDTNGSPNNFDFLSAVGAADVVGGLTASSVSCGCGTNTDWTDSVASADLNCDAGTTCSVASGGGTAVFWYIVTLAGDAGSGSSTYFISDGSVTDSSGTVNFTVVTPDSDGELTSAAGVTEPIAISSIADTSGERVAVFDFTLTDGGTVDGLAMNVSEIVLNTSGTGTFSDITWQLNGSDASFVTGTVAAGTITFSGLSISIADGASETYTVYAYFSTSPASTEDDTFILSVDGDTDLTLSGGTTMGSTSAVTNGSGSTMDVAHTELSFTTEPPSTATTNTDFTGSVIVGGTDVNGNIDEDFSEDITIAAVLDSDKSPGNGTLSSTDSGGLTKSTTSGAATWTDLRYTTGEVINIQAESDTTYTVGVNSSAVTVSAPPLIVLEQSKSNTHTYLSPATSISATLNSTATSGNLLVTAIATDKDAGTYTVPAGFTMIQTYSGLSVSGALAYKVSDGSETAVSWSYTNSEESSVWIGEYSGTDATPLDVSTEADSNNVDTTSQSTGTTGSTAQDEELAVAILAIDSAQNATGRSWSNSFSEVEYVGSNSTAGLSVATKYLTATGTQTSTMSWDTVDQAYAAIATFLASSTRNLRIFSAANQSFTVGDSATAISMITVWEATTQGITAADDIRIQIPSSFNMTWDTSDTTATLGGTASGKVSTTVTYEDSGKTLVLNVTSDFASEDDLTVEGLSFASFSATSAADNLELVTGGSGTGVDATDSKTITIVNPSVSFQDGVLPDASYSGTRDTYINGSSTGTNYGTSTGLNIDGDAPETSLLFKWDLSAVPSGATITGVDILVTSSNDTSADYEIYECTRDWVETQATWNIYSTGNNWQTAGAQGANDRGSTVLGTFEINLNSPGSEFTFSLNADGVQLVQDWVDGVKNNYGIIIQDYAEADGGDVYSREDGTAARRPKLRVSYTPAEGRTRRTMTVIVF